ncbi:hypothetical protein KP509_13G034800 [Ceratopteris richardii]|uniref:Uncharacterized protein n=1 Tax=Ceratopteris richardii TaxID=49495 RepID=A0A8T2TGU2_CERRI|nr:hypothetical protein KP509_13G034800 [Ceratopteris richardii]
MYFELVRLFASENLYFERATHLMSHRHVSTYEGFDVACKGLQLQTSMQLYVVQLKLTKKEKADLFWFIFQFLMYGHAVYTATKYAMRGLAEGLRFELIPYQIRVSVICPGFTSTPFLDEADKDADVRELLQWVDLYNRRWAESTNWVASHVIAAIKSGTFLVTTNPLGLVMATLSRGFVPADSFLRVIFELFFYVPFRLASLIYIPLVRLIVRHKTNTWIRKSTLCPMESSPEKHDESTS